MPDTLSPKKLQRAVDVGWERLKSFRQARMMFLRNYIGQYYDSTHVEVGKEALNLIFNAVRVLVPNLVMSFPRHEVSSEFVAYKPYAEMLARALSHHDKKIKITDIYRRVLVDAIFTLGILKTGLAESDNLYAIDEQDSIDAGTIYTECVDFDNLVVDPLSKEHLFKDAAFIGDRVSVPRHALLESGLYNNALIEKLPNIASDHTRPRARDLSRNSIQTNTDSDAYLYEYVEVVELWLPHMNSIITVPGSKNVHFDEFLRVDDYYGPNSGPYSFLALTPPVPGNPLPVPSVGIWNDLHVLSNRMAKKVIDQAMRQRNILTYRRNAADDAAEIDDSKDGDTIAVDDPDAVKVFSFDGQTQTNEIHLAQLQVWFNTMAANSEALAGTSSPADSATEARILARNASVSIEDMKDMVYTVAAEEASKRAWYIHTDPLINQAQAKRITIPAEYQASPMGPQLVRPASREEVQVFLTPEARQGDFLDYHFTVEPESMGRQDGQTRMAQAMDFAVKILPATMQAAQTAALMGLPFSPKAFLIRMAKARGIDWLDEVFFDPEFQMQLAIQNLRAPQPDNSRGVPVQKPQGNLLSALTQNSQPGQVMGGGRTGEQQFNRESQEGAVEGQRELNTLGF